jgi:hypothetical protein
MFQPLTGSSSATNEINSYKNPCTRIQRFNPLHQKLISHRYSFFLLHLPIVIGSYVQSRMVAQEFTGLTPHQKLLSHHAVSFFCRTISIGNDTQSRIVVQGFIPLHQKLMSHLSFAGRYRTPTTIVSVCRRSSGSNASKPDSPI